MLELLKKKPQIDNKILTAQQFINVKDIRGKTLFTKDGYVFCYIKIYPVSIDLLSENEKMSLCESLSAEISSERKPFKFFAISRPVDISALIDENMAIYTQSNDIVQKTLLSEEVGVYNHYALSGNVIERQFYLIIWEKINEDAEHTLIKRAKELIGKLSNCNVSAEIINSQQIIQLCNLFANPSYAHIEDYGISPSIPILKT